MIVTTDNHLVKMHRFFFMIVLACFVALSIANPSPLPPGRDVDNKAMRRIEDKKETQRKLQEGGTDALTLADAWRGRENEAADRAEVTNAVAYIDMETLEQSYLFVVDEFIGGDVRRQNACRYTTTKTGKKTKSDYYVS